MKRIKATIFLCVLLSGVATTIMQPVLAPLVRELQLSESQGGWMLTLGFVAMTLAATSWGIACDRVGRRPVMLLGLIGLSISCALHTAVVWLGLTAVIAGTALFVLLVATRALMGAVLPATRASCQALMADYTQPAERSSGMAIIGSASGLGLVIGPALGGLVALGGLLWPLVAACVLCLAAAVVVIAVLPKDQVARRESKRASKINPFTPTLLPWLAVGFVIMYSVITTQIVGGFYFQDTLGLTPAETAPRFAAAIAANGAGVLVMQVLLVRWLRAHPRPLVMWGAALWIVSVLILVFTTSLESYIFAYAVLGVGGGIMMPGYMAGASLAVPPEQQGAVAGLANAAQGLGFAVGPVASTMLYEVDRSLPIWSIAVVNALLIVFFVLRVPVARPALLDAGGMPDAR